MGCNSINPIDCRGTQTNCPDKYGCPPGQCPDFQIKRHDTKPSFKVSVEDCDGPLDLTGLVLEVNMWAKGRLKNAITQEDTSLQLADNIGFCQTLPGDIIVMDRVRSPEWMLVTGFDEDNYIIFVERGYNMTPISNWKKGSKLRIFRLMNSPAVTEMILEPGDEDGDGDGCIPEVKKPPALENTNHRHKFTLYPGQIPYIHVPGPGDFVGIPPGEHEKIKQSFLVYDWTSVATCTPGCYWMEFKLIKMMDVTNVPSVTPLCFAGLGVEWVRRFPATGEGFLVQVIDSPTAEI
jgi:hypothetical protein